VAITTGSDGHWAAGQGGHRVASGVGQRSGRRRLRGDDGRPGGVGSTDIDSPEAMLRIKEGTEKFGNLPAF
jgi:hypothetical protein